MNKKKNKKNLIFLGVVLWAVFGFSSQNPEIKQFIKQVKNQAVPLISLDPETKGTDLNVLKEVIGDARIVLLGESQHAKHEQYQLKHRLVRFLVEKMDFNHIAIEDSFYGTIAIDQYIKGLDLSPENTLSNTGGWYLWDTEEMLSMIKWLKGYNDSEEDNLKVSYTGIDIQDPWPGIRYIYNYFEKNDSEYSEYIETKKHIFNVFDQPIWFKVKYNYTKLSTEHKKNIKSTLKEIFNRLNNYREIYTKKAGDRGFKDAVLVVMHLLKSHECFMGFEESDSVGGSIREKAMFENVIRIMEESEENSKLIVWVHNAHAAKSRLDFLSPANPELDLELLGTMLKKRYGDSVKAIGMASLGKKKKEQSFQINPDVLDHVLSDAGMDIFFLNFDKLTGQTGENNLLEAHWKLTADQGIFLSLVPANAYDGMFFIKHVTDVRYSKISSQRLRELFKP